MGVIEKAVDDELLANKASLEDGLNSDQLKEDDGVVPGYMRETINNIRIATGAKFSEARKAFGEAIASVTEYQDKFLKSERALLDVLTARAVKATEARTALQSQLDKLMGSVQMHFCQAPDEGTVPWNGNARQMDMGRRYDSFALAYAACGQMPGCGHVMKLEVAPGKLDLAVHSDLVDNKMKSDLLGMTGYYLANRSEAEFDPQEGFGVIAAQGTSPCDEVHTWWAAKTANRETGADEGAMIDLLHELCESLILRNIEYSCPVLCPSSCVAPVDGRVCMQCASASRECFGTSSASPADTIDCRNCNAAAGIVVTSR